MGLEHLQSQTFRAPWTGRGPLDGEKPPGPGGPIHSSSPTPAPAHTPDLNGQLAAEGRQCLDRAQLIIRELRTGLDWD